MPGYHGGTRDSMRHTSKASYLRDMRTSILVAALVSLVVLSGCDRNIEPYIEGEEAREPDLSRILPAEQPQGAMAGGSPGVAPQGRGAPAMGSGATAAAPAADAAPIRGVVRLGPEVAGRVPARGVLFVIARRGEGPGPPLAVAQIPQPSFPQEFEIGPSNVMIPSLVFDGALRLSARLDSDGNATTRRPGDLTGAATGEFAPGSEGVEILLIESL